MVKGPGRRCIARVREARRLTRPGSLRCDPESFSRVTRVLERQGGDPSDTTNFPWGIGSLTGEVAVGGAVPVG